MFVVCAYPDQGGDDEEPVLAVAVALAAAVTLLTSSALVLQSCTGIKLNDGKAAPPDGNPPRSPGATLASIPCAACIVS